jgi:putative tryptophan/tyrosine transport system substrate-binding protein
VPSFFSGIVFSPIERIGRWTRTQRPVAKNVVGYGLRLEKYMAAKVHSPSRRRHGAPAHCPCTARADRPGKRLRFRDPGHGVDRMRRRDFIKTIVGSAAAAWPLAARAQQPDRMRRIGVLMNLAADDPEAPARVAAFAQGLQESGWTMGRNVRIDYRWGAGVADLYRRYGAELVALTPDLILASGVPAVSAVQQASRTMPVVFVDTTDPVAAGFVASLARPGGYATGFTQFEFGMSGKWLELLKEIAPGVTRAAVIRNPMTPAGSGQLGAIQAVAPSLRVEISPIDVRDTSEIEHAVAAFAREPTGGLVVLSTSLAVAHRDEIISSAGRHRLPAAYPFRIYVNAGGLVRYGPDQIDPYWRAAGYVDRILKGAKPADLPVQAPTKYELVINLKTAKALGIELPPTLSARADDVIE